MENNNEVIINVPSNTQQKSLKMEMTKINGNNNEKLPETTELIKSKENYSCEINMITHTKSYKCIIVIDNDNNTLTIKSSDNDNKLTFKTINFYDIIGTILNCELNPNPIPNKQTESTTIKIFYFPKINIKGCCVFCCCKIFKCCLNQETRQLKSIEIQPEKTNINELFNILNLLTAKINILSNEIILKRNYLVFINPRSGKGKSFSIWQNMKDTFEKSSIEVQLITTNYYRHAYEYIKTADLKGIHGIVSISGDGIIHEIINGLMHRDDKTKINIPIGHIPAGGGNGLSKSITTFSNEPFNIESSTFLACKGNIKKIDLMEIEFASMEKPVYAFSLFAYGFVADAGLASETIRCCGEFRFKCCALVKMVCLCRRKYFVSIHHTKENRVSHINLDKFPSINETVIDDENINKINDRIQFVYIMNIPWQTDTIHGGPKTKFDDGLMDVFFSSGITKCELTSILKKSDMRDHFINDKIDPSMKLKYFQTNVYRMYPKLRLNDIDKVDINTYFPNNYSVDGERYKVEAIQIKLRREAMNVFGAS